MPRRYHPLDLYVTLVVATGAACAVLVLGTGYDTLDQFLDPELALFALCALVGELVPLKVHTRGSEGEVTTSTCFALALMLAGGPAVGMAGLLAASILADTINRKPVKKIAFNAAQYSISVTAASLLLIFTDVPETAGPLPFGPEDLIPILGVAAIFFVVNSALVSTVVALAQGVIKLGRYLANDLFFQASTAGLLLGLSPVVVLAAEFSLPALLLLLLPFLAVHRGGRAAIAKEHQSLHDALTGLPNRTLFRDRIEQAITAGRRSDVDLGRDADRPRSLQGDQRHARPPRGRPPAGGGRAPAPGVAAASATPSPASAATSSACCCPRCAAPATPTSSRASCSPACASRSRSRASRSRSTRASAWPATPRTARASRR